MIKKGLKNYFKSFKYFFTPLGVIALGTVIGLSILIPGVMNSVKEMITGVSGIVSETDINWSAAWSNLLDSVRALDWSAPGTAASQMFDKDWLTATFNGCITAIFEGANPALDQIKALVLGCVQDLGKFFAVFVIVTVLAMIVGYVLVRFQIRRDIVKRSLLKTILLTIAHALINVTVIIACLNILSKVSGIAALGVALLFFILLGFISLIEAYVVHAVKKVKFTEIVNMKNVALLLLTNVIIFAISAAFIYFVYAVINAIVGTFLSIVFIEIASIVIGLNAESYVVERVEKKGGGEKNAD